MSRNIHKDESLFLKELISKQEITKDLVMLLFEREGIMPGKLFKAKIDFSGIIDTPNPDSKNLLVATTKIDGVPTKYVRRDRHNSKSAFIHKGDLAMFVDVDCEAVTSGSTLVSMKFLINEKVIRVACEFLEESIKPKEPSVFSNLNINQWLSFWRTVNKTY